MTGLVDGASAQQAAPVSVLTPDTLVPAEAPTLYFVGVTTGGSSIQRVFPLWARELGLPEARLQGVDLPVGAPAEDYRRVVDFIAADPMSRGAQVTTHKIDLFAAAGDRFAEVRPLARLMSEVSLVAKRDSGLVAFAKDPVTSGLALDALVPPGHWERTGASALLLGAGGAGVAITWSLGRPELGADRPAEVIVTDRSPERLEHIRAIHRAAEGEVPLSALLVGDEGSDRLLADLPEGSLVVNATGLGKDLPGSPLTDAAVFPRGAIAWELNYRGDLVFLEQAMGQAPDRVRTAVDGWTYFLHGWLQAVREVFEMDVPTSGPDFERLSRLARSVR